MDPGLRDILGEIRLEIVVAGDFQHFSAFLVQPQPEPALHQENVLHVHDERGGDPREGIGHHRDQRPVPESANGLYRDSAQETPALGGGENRRFSAPDTVLRPSNRGRWRARHHLVDSQPVEEAPDCGELLLDGRARGLPHPDIEPGGDVVTGLSPPTRGNRPGLT